MNRPLLFVSAAYAAGIAAAGISGINYTIAFIIIAAAFCAYFFLHKKYPVVIFPLFFSLGLLLFSYQINHFGANDINSFSDAAQVKSVKVVVDSDPESNNDRTYFYARVLSVDTKTTSFDNITGKIRVTLEKKLGAVPKYGDVATIKGKLLTPVLPKNPGEFDYGKYLSYRRVFYTLYAKDTACEKTGENKGNLFYSLSYRAKETLTSIIYSSLPETQARVLDGLMLGNQRAIADDTYDKFKITGTVHILAVSGMNVGMIGFFVFLLLKLLRINRKVCAVITMFLITGFMIITGCGASIVRATIMSYAVLLGILIERDTDVLTSLSAAALLILLVKPAALFDAGFELSFLATVGIVYFIDWEEALFPDMPGWIKATLATTFSAQIFLTPVMINTFHQLSLISVFANMIIVPLSGVISTLGYTMWLFGIVSAGAAKIFGASIWVLIKLMMSVVNILAAIPYAAISVKTLPWLYVFLYYLFFIILPHKDIDIEIKKISMKASLLIVLSVWTIIHVTYPSKPALYCPAGRGINAAFMQTKDNKKILVLGCDSERSPQAVKGSIVPFLKYLGINNIDTLILYSVNEAGNLEALKRAFVIKSVYSDTDVKEYFKQAEIIQGGFYLKEGGETFINLSPIAADITSGNNEFIFAKITDDKLYKRTGDIIYLCQYNEESALRMAKENRCVVNSSNSGFFRKPKPLIDKNISDAGEKLFYYALN